MARPLRIERPGAWYHVTARGNERRTIYRDIDTLSELGVPVFGERGREGACGQQGIEDPLVRPDGDGLSRAIELALANTDQRVREGRAVSPAFLFATLLLGCHGSHGDAAAGPAPSGSRRTLSF